MEEIPVINHETSGHFDILFQVIGTVKSHSRVGSSYIPNETKKLVEFKIKVPKTALVLNGELMKGRGVMRGIHESIRQLFRSGTYTDRREVICEFEAPSNSPWWITIDDISWTILEKKEAWPYKEGLTMDEIKGCQPMDN